MFTVDFLLQETKNITFNLYSGSRVEDYQLGKPRFLKCAGISATKLFVISFLFRHLLAEIPKGLF